MKKLKEIIEAQADYIKLLEGVCKANAIILFNKGIMPDQKDIEDGVVLREKIKLLNNIPIEGIDTNEEGLIEDDKNEL